MTVMKKIRFADITAVCLLLCIHGPAAAQLKVKPDGNVGIGTNNPVTRLHVYGEGLVDSYAPPWGRAFWTRVHNNDAGSYFLWNSGLGRDVFFVNGRGWQWSMQGTYTGADGSMMEGVAPIGSPLDVVRQLNGIRFRYRGTSGGGEGDGYRLGFVAREVAQVVPEAVKIMPDSTGSIAYDALVPLLVEAVKEQQEQIDALRAFISYQEEELIKLKRRRWNR